MPDWRDSIVLLTSSDPDNSGFGTGFVFHRDTTGRCFLLTCLHVVATLEKPSKGATGEPPGILAADRPAEVCVHGDGILDLAVLAVDGLALEPLRLGSPAQRGTPIQTAGFTDFEVAQKSVVRRPLEGTIRDNIPVWSRWPKARRRAWSLDIEIDAEAFRALAEGYSGSPVLDPTTGAVVGIMNLKWSGTKGHAICVRSCDLFDPPLSQRLPDYPPRPSGPATLLDTQAPQPSAAAAAEGALDWLASTMDHDRPIEQVALCLDDGQGGSHPGLWFCAFDACLSDCPRALAEHLAVKFGGLSPSSPWLDDLVTELRPDRYDARGLWKALAAKITPFHSTAPARADEADRILHWINAGPSVGPGGLRVVYCQLSVADKGARIPGLIAGAIGDFSALRGLRADARVLFLFACVFEESGVRGLLGRWRRPRLGHLQACESLGALAKLSPSDIDIWLREVSQAGPGRRRLDDSTQKRLHATLEPLFPSDAARRRYQQVRRPALDILAQATLSAANPGDPA